MTELTGVAGIIVDSGPRQDKGEPTYKAPGFVQKVAYVYNPASLTKDSILVSSRKRGRPFSQRRGRRSASR